MRRPLIELAIAGFVTILVVPRAGAQVPPREPILAEGVGPGTLAPGIDRSDRHQEPREERVTLVPPTLEIEVLDPNVDPLGNPAVLTQPGPDGNLVVEIPPVVLVHRYYYTGDRSFRGPMLPGGPSIVVANHPRTGERLYVPLQMLPGSPWVTYRHDAIEYDYGPQAITVKFGHHGRPEVVYRQGVPLGRRLKQAREERHERFQELVDRSGLPVASDRVHEAARSAALRTIDGTRTIAKMAITPVAQIVQSTPLGSLLTISPEEEARRARDTAVRRASTQLNRFEGDIPTIR